MKYTVLKFFPLSSKYSEKGNIDIELLENHTYSTADMYNFFEVSKDTWKKKKDDLLLHLQQYYEYEIQYNKNDRRKLNYHIIRKLKDYEPLKGKKAKQNDIYSEQIINVIEIDNLQTAMNVSRIIKNHKEIMDLNHKDGTIYEYTRVNMRTMFGREIGEGGTRGIITDKVWCVADTDHNIYIVLDDTQVEFLYSTFYALKKENKQDDLSICADYDSGLITKEEMQEKLSSNSLSCFIAAQNEFKIKYGHYPVKVPVYEISAFEIAT